MGTPAAGQAGQILVLGLGRMGSEIARVLARAGRPVRGWNRTALDPAPWSADGVALSADLAQGVQEAWLVVAVPFAYGNTRDALDAVAASGGLRGKVVLNLSWGSLAEAAEMSAWCADAGAAYLDGALLCYPDEIGGPGGRIVVSGSGQASVAVLDAVAPLGPVQYLGEDPAAANAVGTAAGMVFYHAALAAFFEAIAFASRFGVGPAALLPEVRGMLDLLSAHFEKDIATIEAGTYSEPSASMDVHLEGVRLAIADLDAAGQRSPLMLGFVELVSPLVEAGHGDESIARLYDALRH